nr:hypothetical protein [Tanacetum cinerariifolium]
MKTSQKTPYELLHTKKPDLSYFYTSSALCYPTNNSEDLGKLKPKADIGIFVGYALVKKMFRIYNKRTRLITKTIHVDFDELASMAFEQFSSGPSVASLFPIVAAPVPANLTGLPSSTLVDQDAPSLSTSQTPQASQSPFASPSVVEEFHDIKVAHLNNDPFFGVPIPEPTFKESSSRDVIPINNYKEALKESYWIKAMQEELNKFERLEVWKLVPHPDRVMIITLKWIFKVKLDELGGVLKNKAWLVARGYRQEEGIEFKESFTLVAQLRAIRIFIAYSAHMNMIVYQIDVKITFMNDVDDGRNVVLSKTSDLSKPQRHLS